MKKILATLAIVAMTAVSAQAASVSYNTNYGPTSVSSAPFNVQLPKFDPSLGTLVKVTLTLDANTDSGSIAWDNEGAVGGTVDLGIGAEVTATAPSALTAVAVPLQVGNATVDADNDVAADFIGTDSFSVTGGSGSDSDTDMSTLPAVLTAYTAAFLGEQFDVNIAPSIETFLSTSGAFGPINPTPGLTDGLVAVTYEYTTIPTPAAGGMALMGLAGLALRRRR